MNFRVQVKEFSHLEPSELEQLKSMMYPDGLFSLWLSDEKGYSGRYAAVAHQEENVIGWAAVDIGEGPLSGVGAFVSNDHRGQGVAKACLERVLGHAREMAGDFKFLKYDQSYGELFVPAIRAAGFNPSSARLIVYRNN